MTDEPENLTLKLLREMRAEMREGFEKAFSELTELRGAMSELQTAVAAIRGAQQNHGARLNAIDGRLALIETHTGGHYTKVL
jgi:predicted  nucleic acid-binding Zn-ribbon protein